VEPAGGTLRISIAEFANAKPIEIEGIRGAEQAPEFGRTPSGETRTRMARIRDEPIGR
jgi:hypothetical protein